MLHAGVQRCHGQIVGVHDVVDVAGQAQRKLSHGDQQGVAAAGSGALDVHGRAAGGLAQAASHVLAQVSQPLDEAQRRGGLALSQRRGGDGRDLDIFAAGPVLQPLHDAQKIQLGRLAVGNKLLRQEAHPAAELLHRRQRPLCRRADLPVGVDCGVQHDPFPAVRIAAVCKPYLHVASSPVYSADHYTQCPPVPSITVPQGTSEFPLVFPCGVLYNALSLCVGMVR